MKGIAKLLSTPIVSAVFLLVATAAVAQPAFDVSVPSALLIDAGTGQVLLEKQPRWPFLRRASPR